MAGKIFVSYRRDDDPNGAARIRDALTAKFGRSSVFMDVDDLLAGLRFDEELAKALAACDVFLAVIGPRWMDLLKARASGPDRDYVREEIAEALKRKIVVIPVRVGREGQLPPLPRTDDLPSEIRDLVHYQKHDVIYEYFGRDANSLVDAITAVRLRLRPVPVRTIPHVPWGWVGATAASVLAIGYTGGYYAGVPVPWPAAPPTDTRSADATARTKAEQDAKARADEVERLRIVAAKAEEDRKRQADEAAKLRAEAEARQKKDDEDRKQAALKADDDRKRAAAEAKRIADEEAARRDPALSVSPGSGQSFHDRLANGQPCPMCPEMVVAPAGHFTMGSSPAEITALKKEYNNAWYASEGPQRRVSIARPFAVGRYAVTFAEWDACVADGSCNGHKPGDQGWGRGKRPVINVNWDDAKAYASWLSRKTGKTYRLLSEAEREYAARAGTTTAFWWGSSISTRQANYDGNYTLAGSAKGEYRQQTLPVDGFEPNPWGLYQVHGNVYDWTEDCWHENYESAPTDGSAWTTACSDAGPRVVRGGSWYGLPQVLRAANRVGYSAGSRGNSLGFRLARTLNP